LGTELNSFLDAKPTWEELEFLASTIDGRAAKFRSGACDWQAEYIPSHKAAMTVPAVKYSTAEQLIEAIQSFSDLKTTPGGMYSDRVRQYWAVIDAAMGFPEPEVADALVKTYLTIHNAAVQESVHRVLRTFPEVIVFDALVRNIVALRTQTDWADSLVDIFDEDIKEEQLQAMVEHLDIATRYVRSAYIASLSAAERNGSRYASRFLKAHYD